MKIKSERFGQLEVDEQQLITFAQGIPGLEDFKSYVLLPADDRQETPFFFLQSAEEAGLSFFLLDPFSVFPHYDFELEESEEAELAIEQVEDVRIFTTVTANGSLKEATTNLKAPLVINVKRQVGKQIVLDKANYPIKQPLWDANQQAKG